MAPHFVEYVKKEGGRLDALGDDAETRLTKLLTAGYTIETTLDLKLFRASEEAARKRLGEPGDPFTATASVEPGDGAVLSLMGGLDYGAVQFDFASQSHRQPGSAFKPFVYMAALRDRIDPRTTFDGTSGRLIPCYGRPVSNYAGEDAGGQIDVDQALGRSVNVVFVDLGCRVGVSDVVEAAHDAGVPEDATRQQGAVFLGGLDQGVSPLTMAAAYATFASGGVYAEPYAITAIRNPAGKVIYKHHRSTRRVFQPEQAAVLNRALTGVVTEGTGRGAGIGRPVAGKTGTTQGNIDAWFVGFVPQVATAVWVGYEPQRPMSDVHGRAVTGGSFPAAIFADLMRVGLRGVPVEPFPVAEPDALGLRPTTTTASTIPPALVEESTTSTTNPAEGTTTSTGPVTTTTERTRRPPD
jgi:penicillin-binding protein 1A